jgi:ElaB/YqjD/DUF883 family membrane-anchored ribosome-binding protein
MTTSKTSRSTASYADDAEGTLEHTRLLAAQALERATERMRDLSMGARDLASRGLSTVSDKTAVAQERIGRYADATGRYVSDQPVRSALIAAGVGALITIALLTARRRSRRQF